VAQRAGSATARRWGALVVVALVVAGCGNQATPIPSATSAAASSSTPAPTVTPAAFADTLRVGYAYDWFYAERQASSAIIGYGTDFGFLVHAALYRYDAQFGAVPDLADGPCVPQGDGTVLRCRLVEATFHDGTPVTADDVAYMYGLARRPTFPIPVWGGAVARLSEVRVIDPRTVDFVLSAVDPAFIANALAGIPILPRHVVEASFADFAARTAGLQAEDLTKLAGALEEQLGGDPPDCTSHLGEVGALLEAIGVRLYREDFSRGASATFDSCAYLGIAGGLIGQAATATGASGLDAVAAAYSLLSIDWRPVGAGPYRLASEDAAGFHLEAWPGYHGGPAATRFVDYVPANPDGSGLLDGTVDILWGATLDTAFVATAGSHGVMVATAPDLTFYQLYFNMRPGRLFANRALRQALQLCVDLPRDVDSATGGGATAIYSPITPGTWAWEPSIPKPSRDPTAARQLIEGAGWTAGADGVYVKDGVRLTADIVVRADREARIRMADLIANDARACGMDLRSWPTTWVEILGEFFMYPHNIPGTGRPFDVYLGGLVVTSDPADVAGVFSSSQVTDAEHPDANTLGNIIGFSDPTVDRLIAAAASTYDQAERAPLYRELQRELAAQLPVLFLWTGGAKAGVRSAVATVDGPLDLDVPNWAWQPERLVVVASP
jgi:ABC-type transport system substrate-binding protein